MSLKARFWADVEYIYMSFRHVKRRNETELSKHLWKLKDENREYTVT